MAIRQYRPRGNRRRGISQRSLLLQSLLLAAFIALEITYPLTHGDALTIVTISTVLVGAVLVLFHSILAYGRKFFALYAIITLTYGYLIELLGVHSGWPFGTYHYSRSLGVQILGVPLIVPCAWALLTYPVLIAARKATHNWAFVYGALGLVACDYFLDPQMVAAGRWSWKLVGPRAPFESNIPLSNLAGWLFAGMGLIALLNTSLPRERRKNGASTTIPDFLLLWTFFAGFIGNLFFFHRAGVALFGGIFFFTIFAPYAFISRYSRPDND